MTYTSSAGASAPVLRLPDMFESELLTGTGLMALWASLLAISDTFWSAWALAVAACCGYVVAVMQRQLQADRDHRRLQRQLQSILKNTAALQSQVLDLATREVAEGFQGDVCCRSFAEFEAALLDQIERLVRHDRHLQQDLDRTRCLLNRRSAELQLSHTEARTDSLSSVLNRRGFDETLDLFLQSCRRSRHPFSLLLIDIDHFKQINDEHGHLVGDQVLSWVGTRLVELTRPTDCVARFGGDEFAVLLREVDLARAQMIAARLLDVFRGQPFVAANAEPAVAVTLSVGLALAEPQDRADRLIDKADQALYICKRHGRDRVHAYQPSDPTRLVGVR